MIVPTPYPATSRTCGCQGSCHCGQSPCDSTGDHGFSRPNFFAGQLLTDEDLRAALDYVVQKNRLHNRHFFGEGVVCGLQVVRHPCPDQKERVFVLPGHALDSCGNDILVPCEVELDILKMVHELRTRLRRGHDCGDPCDQPQDKGNGQDNGETDGDEKEAPMEFDLYVRYREMESELVTPYQTDADCGAPCRASRIRESYQFRLTCPQPDSPPDDLRTRMEQCRNTIENYGKYQADAIQGISALEMARKVLVQFGTVAKALNDPTVKDRLRERIEVHADPEEPVEASVTKVVADIKAVQGEDPAFITAEQQQRLAIVAHEFLTLAYRVLYTPPAGNVYTNADGPINTVQALLETALEWPLETDSQAVGDANVTQEPLVSQKVIQLLQTRNRGLIQAVTHVEPAESFAGKSQVTGELVDVEVAQLATDRLQQINDALRGLIQIGVVSVDPRLRADMGSVRLGGLNMSHQLEKLERLAELRKQAAIVGRAVAEISKKCLCEIVLPPCPPANDREVLLARVTVQECEVVDICNLARRFVITGPALRYWFSDFGSILGPIRRKCCPTPEEVKKAKDDAEEADRQAAEDWEKEVADPSGPASTPRLDERVDNPAVWKHLQTTSAFGELSRTAVEPPPATAFDPLAGDGPAAYQDLSEQSFNLVLSQFAGRPPTDIRELLDRSEDLKTANSVERIAQTKLNEAKNELGKLIDDATTKSNRADINAAEAIRTTKQFPAALQTEKDERVAADLAEVTDRNTAIGNAVAQEVTERNTAIGNAVAQEVTDRNTAIGNAVAQEVTERNTAIGNAVAQEVTERNTAIGNAVAQEVTERNTAIGNAVAQEVTERNTAIGNAVAQEVTDRNTAIGNAVAQEVTDRNTAIGNAVAQEVTERNTAIKAAVDAEAETRAEAIAAEAATRKQQDTAIRNRLNQHTH